MLDNRAEPVHIDEEGIMALNGIQLDQADQFPSRFKFGGQFPLLVDIKQKIGFAADNQDPVGGHFLQRCMHGTTVLRYIEKI